MLSQTANFAAFQLAWWGSVLGTAYSNDWLGLTVSAGALLLHLFLAVDRLAMLKAISLSGVLGYCTDCALGMAGVLQFKASALGGLGLAPLWLLGLWLVFATTLASSLSWLSPHPRLAAAMGGIFGPASYYAGEQLGAMRLGAPLIQSLLTLAVVWSLLMPLLFGISRGFVFPSAAFRRATV